MTTRNERLIEKHYMNDIDLAYDWKDGAVDDETFFDRLHFLNVSDCHNADLWIALKEAYSLIEDLQEENLTLQIQLGLSKAGSNSNLTAHPLKED